MHRYDGVAQLFHWLIAIMIFVIFGLGWYMTDLNPADPATFRLYQIHKGIGISILALAVLRLLWRMTHSPPPLPDTMKSWERFAASATHIALYSLIFLQPMVGILQSNAANFPIVLFGRFELPALIGQDKVMGETLLGLHHLFAKVMAALVLAHIGAALRHHILLKDDVLRRMIPGAAIGVAVLILAVGFLGPQFMSSRTASIANNEPSPAEQTEQTETGNPSPAAIASSTVDQTQDTAGIAWVIEEGSALGFIARQQGSPVPGSFQSFHADIQFDPDDLENSRFSVDIDVTSILTGHNDRDKMLNSPSFFDTETWPTAQFKSTDIHAAADGRYEATAELTMRDVTKTVSLPFSLEITADPDDPTREVAHAKGELPIMRLDYGIGQDDWASTVTVADEVVITIDIQASRTK